MSVKALQEYTFVSKYARFNENLKRREQWSESVDRVRNMHLKKYPNAVEQINWAFDRVLEKRVLGSQRALQFGGAPIEKTNAKIYNCCFSYCDRLRFFQESFYLLLCGSGVGFSVQKHHIAKLPKLHRHTKGSLIFLVSDSIAGWADSLGVLLSSYMDQDSEYFGYRIEFDCKDISPKGTPLSSGAGKCPGPEPLEKSLELIRKLLDSCLDGKDCVNLRPINAYDIVMYASEAVLSGGIRRSATLCLFSPDDMEMVKAKTGNWFYENPQRGRSNNSALLIRNKTTKEQFNSLMQCVKEFGEPGFIWADSTESGFNPSLASGTKVLTSDGIFPIENLEDKEFYVKNLHGEKSKAKCFLSGKKQQLWKVTLVGGKEYYATAEHKWPICNRLSKGGRDSGGYSFVKTETSEIKIGSHLPILTEYELFDGKSGDYDDGFLVGYLFGDGWITKRKDNKKLQFGFIVSEEDYENGMMDKLDSVITKKIGKVNWTKRDNGCFEVNVQRQAAVDYFAKFGIIESDYKKKGLPNFVWTESSEEFRKGLIDGLFSTDGTVADSYSAYNSSRKKLAQDVADLLGFYGIRTGIGKTTIDGNENIFPNDKTYTIYRVRIVDAASLSHFGNLFKITHKSKNDKCHAYCNENIYPKNRLVKIRSVEKTNIYQDVWDISVYDKTHCFQLSQCITGNCVEINLYGYDEFGNSGWEFCNLSEINGKLIKTEEDFAIAAKAGAIIGTLQAGYTSFPYLGEVSERICKQEALLGVSVTGWMENPDLLFNPDIQKRMAELVKKVNAEIAELIGINPAARCTCVKPSGTTSCMLGTSSGIHPHHSRRYFRRVQGNKLESPLQYFGANNPQAIEASVWSKNDSVLTFCIETNDNAIIKDQLKAVDLLEKVKLTQENWVTYGTRLERCIKPWLKNNVSNTITVKPHEWQEVEDFIYEHRENFAGVSLLPSTGDLDYPQAPFCQVSTPDELVDKYGTGAIFASGLIVDGLHAFKDLWVACDAVSGLYKIEEPDENKSDWVRRAKKFAENYFENNTQKMLYCLKEINNYHIWCRLKNTWKDVDYSQLIEEEDETNFTAESACAGGHCSVF